MIGDFAGALRAIRRYPGSSAVAILTMALAVGANTAIFSVIRGVFLRPLPFSDPQRLVEVRECNAEWARQITQLQGRGFNDPRGCLTVSPPMYRDWRDGVPAFEALGAVSYSPERVPLAGGGEPRIVRARRVTTNLFPLLGVEPMIGRTFAPDEDQTAVVILGHAIWRQNFGGERSIIGKDVLLNGASHRVVGVMPAGFDYPDRTEAWLPKFIDPKEGYGSHNVNVVGRLRPGATMQEAVNQMAAISAAVAATHPGNKGWVPGAESITEHLTKRYRRAFAVLAIAVLLVLAIACANLSNLMLARVHGRSVELAIRVALGAGRARLIRASIAESLVLALAGGALGLLMLVWTLELVRALLPADLPRVSEITIDGTVLLFSFVATTLAGLVFGLVPAVRASVADTGPALRPGNQRSVTAGRGRLSHGLVTVQVSAAVLLLVGAGLMIGTFERLSEQPLGFEPEHLLTFRVPLARVAYPSDRAIQFYSQLMARLNETRGVVAAAAAFPLPFTGDQQGRGFEIEGRTGEQASAQFRGVTPEYFRTMRIPLLLGRTFTENDRLGRPDVIVVNQTFAKRYFPTESPLGKRIYGWKGDKTAIQIVGVVGDVRHQTIERESGPEVYAAWYQLGYWRDLSVAVRHTGGASALLPAIREAVHSLDRNQAIDEVRPMPELVARSSADRRVQLVLFSIFSSMALLIAAIGVYAVMSYAVARRTSEIGIRVAMGARPLQILELVIGQAFRPVALGMVIGIAGALLLARAIESFLYGIPPHDPATLAGACAVLVVAASLACVVPALRALRISPIEALRS